MIDDPAKSIRRAVMVAKGLAKKIDQLPSGNRMQAPHPASMIPGVHVMGMDGAQGYADGGSTPAWQRKEGQNPSGGLNSKGRASYHSETGGTLKPPVKAGDNPRRSSFLARMGNMPGPEHDEHGEPTRLLKSLQAWGASSKADARAKAHAIHKGGGGVVEPTDETGFDAWHGTPHTFAPEPGAPLGRFRSDKIGTGEGAQAFGHGLYVGQEGTARGYRDRLAHKGAIDIEGESHALGIPLSRTAQIELIRQSRDNVDSLTAAKRLQNASIESRPHEVSVLSGLIQKYRDSKQGHLLHVRVRANPEHFLDWDKSLSEQHPHVQAALENLHGEKISPTANLLHPSNKGEKIYYGTAVKHGKYAETNAAPAAELLKQAGIPGIRYLDANSRDPDTDQPTHNHVVFDPSIIDIKHRYASGGGVDNDPTVQKALGITRNLSPKGLYSQGAETAANLPQAKGPPRQMMEALSGRGVKSEEMKWSGVENAFANHKSVTRDQLAQHFQKNLPDIHETQIPEDDSQYSEHTIPGGSKYRELVIHKGKGDDFLNKAKFHQWVAQRAEYNAIQDEALSGGKEFQDLPYGDQDAYLSGAAEEFHESGLNPHNTMAYHREPGVGEFQSVHYPQSNVLGHIRMSDRDDGRTLHLEEMQSDWGQEARKNPILAQAPHIGKTENWTDMLLKRALHEAASKGYDRLAWTPGQDQVDRYGLEHHVHELSYDPEEKTLSHYNSTKGWKKFPGEIEKHEIYKHVGKDLSEQLLNSKPHVLNNNLFVKGLDQKVGGEGMRSYYDRIVPQRLADVTKKLGAPAAIEPHTIDANGEQKTLHSIRITPELREAVLKGMPAYARGGDVDLPHKGEGGMLGASKQGENDGIQTAAGDSQNGTQAGELRGQGGLRGSQGVLPAPGPTSGEAPLEGLPRKIKVPRTGATIIAGPDPRVRGVAAQYAQSMGMRYAPPARYVKVDPERGKRISDAYEAMPHDPHHPLVKAAYEALARETMAQYAAAKKAGFKAEFWHPEKQDDPYADSPRYAVEDVRHNHHMYVFPTYSGYGSKPGEKDSNENPLLRDSGEKWNGHPVMVNDIFRAIHDYYGHAKEGVGFRADGEENAWRSHAAMFSPLARLALGTETRGQNSWLNYGPHGEKNRSANTDDTVFALPKIGILPHWVHHEGAEDFMSPEDIHAMAQAYHQHRSDGGVDRALQTARMHANFGGFQDAPFRHIEARSPGWGDTWTPLHEIQGKLKSPISSISDSAANFGDFMSSMAHKASTRGLAPRDLIKAYLMTISSQGRQAVKPKTVLKNWPDYPGPTHGKIRPEGAMGEWLASPMGRRYLDAAEQGKVDPEAVQHALKSFNGFGFADSHEGDAMPWAAQTLVPHTKMDSDMIAESVKGRHSSEDWRRWVKKNVNGVGFAKAGFFASMLGRGDQPVPDARQLVLNTPEGSKALKKIGSGGSSAPSTLREGEAIDRLAARQRALSLAHPKELAPHYQSLAHHTIWDAANGTDTTHQDVIDAMRHAASGGLIGGEDEHPVVTIMKHLGMPGLQDDKREHYDRGGGKGLSPNDAMVQNALKRVAAQQANSFTRSGAQLIGRDASFLNRQQQMSQELTKTPGIPLHEMESTHISKETLDPWKELTPEALYDKKAYIAPFLGDRTPAGTILTHVNGIPLAKPVNQQGGGDFTRSEAAQGDDPAAWGNRDRTARMMFAQIKGQVPEGSPVFGGHVAMGLASADSSHQVAQTLLQLMPHMNIHPDHIEKFDKKMREALPPKGKTPAWPGVMNTDEAERYFKATPGTHASVFAKMMEGGEWRKHGFPDVGLARFANTEHRLLNAPNLSTGYAFSGIDTSKPLIRDAPHGHETYSTLIPSSTGYAGGFKHQVPARLVFPKFYSELKPKDKNGKPIDYNSPGGTTLAQQSMMTKTPVQKTDQEWLDNIMQHQEQNPQKWGYKNGGNAVTHALSIARKAIKR
jgi:hypothetical protein